MSDDNRTLNDLAKEALAVQNASNLSGVVISWGKVIVRLRQLLQDHDTNQINAHPINQLWADKVAHLTNTQTDSLVALGRAYDAVERLTKQES